MKKFKLAALLFISGMLAAFAQENVSIHKLHRNEFGRASVREDAERNKKLIFHNVPIRPLDDNAVKSLSKAVFGYLPDWEYLNGNHVYLRYDLLTHIACFDFAADSDGNISNPAGWPWTDVINKAHDNGVKVILTVTKFGGSASANAEIHKLLTNPSSIENFYSQVISKLKTYQLDGVNIDFETYASEDEGQVTVDFMRGLTERIHAEIPGAEVSFATPIINWGGDWDLPALVDAIDYAFVMGYAFRGKWSSSTGAGAPLTGAFRNITRSLNEDYGEVLANSPEKLILGLPYYGLHWLTRSPDAYTSEIDTFIASTRFRAAEPLAQNYGRQWDDESQTPWIKWNVGEWNQIWFDDDSSLALKYDFAIEKNLMGVGMWALGYDGERQELWNLIDMKFGSGLPPVPLTPESFFVTAASNSLLNINFSHPDWAEAFDVFISTDGEEFSYSGVSFDNNIEVQDLSSDSVYYFKVSANNTAGSSAETEVLAGVPSTSQSEILVVNGFDRISGTNNTLDYIKKYGYPILQSGYSFSSASNEAIFKGIVDLQDYQIVVWILGDESRADETFNSLEQSKVKEYLEAGGNLFVSGSEIGYDLVQMGGSADKEFFAEYMKANYISDAPNDIARTYYSIEPLANEIFDGIGSIYFDDGSHGTFDVDWPDAVEAADGGSNILKFKELGTNVGYAGIAYEGSFGESSVSSKLVYLTIPFETIYPDSVRINLMNKVLSYFDKPTSVENNFEPVKDFVLHNNYPNPFNPTTTIKYNIPVVALSPVEGHHVSLKIYDILGRTIATLVDEQQTPGNYSVVWDASNHASGIYFYELRIENQVSKVMVFRKKMILLK